MDLDCAEKQNYNSKCGRIFPYRFRSFSGKKNVLKTNIKLKKGREAARLCLLWGELWIPVPEKNTIYIYSLKGKQVRKLRMREDDVMPYTCASCSHVTFALVSKQGGLILGRIKGDIVQRLNCSGSDVCFFDNKLFFLESRRIVTFSHNGSVWVPLNVIGIEFEDKVRMGSLIVLQDRIFVASFTGNRIYKCSRTGEIQDILKEKDVDLNENLNLELAEEEKGDISYPVLCGADFDGTLMYCNITSSQIQMLRIDGEWEVLSIEDSYPSCVVQTARDSLWLLCEEDDCTLVKNYEFI